MWHAAATSNCCFARFPQPEQILGVCAIFASAGGASSLRGNVRTLCFCRRHRDGPVRPPAVQSFGKLRGDRGGARREPLPLHRYALVFGGLPFASLQSVTAFLVSHPVLVSSSHKVSRANPPRLLRSIHAVLGAWVSLIRGLGRVQALPPKQA